MNLTQKQINTLINDFRFKHDNFSNTIACNLIRHRLVDWNSQGKYSITSYDGVYGNHSFNQTPFTNNPPLHIYLDFFYYCKEEKPVIGFLVEHRGNFCNYLSNESKFFIKNGGRIFEFNCSEFEPIYKRHEFKPDELVGTICFFDIDTNNNDLLNIIINSTEIEFSILYGVGATNRINGIIKSNYTGYLLLKKIILTLGYILNEQQLTELDAETTRQNKDLREQKELARKKYEIEKVKNEKKERINNVFSSIGGVFENIIDLAKEISFTAWLGIIFFSILLYYNSCN